MHCRYCGAPLRGTERFCGECGAKLEIPAEPVSADAPALTRTPPESLTDETPEAEVPAPEPIEDETAAEMPERETAAETPEIEIPAPAVPVAAPARPTGGAQQNPNAGSYRNPYVQPQNPYTAERAPSRDDPGRVLSTGGFLLSLFLMLLPFVGLVLQIVWSCNGTTNSLNRRNLARACLILTCVGFVLTIILVVLVGVIAGLAAFW